jgi:uncharacterized membrane-anchored protein YhcB (DUF1043 family)
MIDQFQVPAGGGFALLMLVVGIVIGALGYRWLVRNQAEKLAAAEAKLAELDDKRRGG